MTTPMDLDAFERRAEAAAAGVRVTAMDVQQLAAELRRSRSAAASTRAARDEYGPSIASAQTELDRLTTERDEQRLEIDRLERLLHDARQATTPTGEPTP